MFFLLLINVSECHIPDSKYNNLEKDTLISRNDTDYRYIENTSNQSRKLSITDFIGVWKIQNDGKSNFVMFNQDKAFYLIENENGNTVSQKGSWDYNSDSNLLHYDLNGDYYFYDLSITYSDSVTFTGKSNFEGDNFELKFERVRDNNGKILLYSEAFKTYLTENTTSDNSDNYANNYNGGNNSESNNSTPQYETCDACNGSGRCSNCNKSFRVHYWDYNTDQWKDRNEMRPGQVMCSTCSGAGVIYGSFQGNLKDPETRPCYINGCQGGWLPCNECNANGNGERPGQCRRCYGKGVIGR